MIELVRVEPEWEETHGLKAGMQLQAARRPDGATWVVGPKSGERVRLLPDEWKEVKS